MSPKPSVITATILLLLVATPAFAQQAVKPLPPDSEVVQKALKGDATSQFLVGLGYEMTGEVVNFEEAAKWFRKAADQGDANAQDVLGATYAEGLGVAQDHAEAVKWYRKAADQGVASAQNALGRMYANGEGVAQDYVQAHLWFNLAAARFPASRTEDRDRVVKNRDAIAAKMTPAQIAEAQRLAREWKPK